MSLPLLSLRLPHHVELPGAPLRLAHPVKVLQKHVDLLGAYHLVLWRQRPVVCGDVGLYTGLPARGAPRKTFFFLVQNRRGALRRSKTRKQNQKKNQNRAVETRRDERDMVSAKERGWGRTRRATRRCRKWSSAQDARSGGRTLVWTCYSRGHALCAGRPRRRGDEVPLISHAAAAGRDLRLEVVGARLEKFEALRDGRFEMKDTVPCSGLEPLQSASMVADGLAAALLAETCGTVCLLHYSNPRSPRPREGLGKIGKCSISHRAKVSLVGEHENQKSIDCF